MTTRGLTLNFDSELDFFDSWQSNMSQMEDIDGPTELEVLFTQRFLSF